jgi:hypothetical protein
VTTGGPARLPVMRGAVGRSGHVLLSRRSSPTPPVPLACRTDTPWPRPSPPPSGCAPGNYARAHPLHPPAPVPGHPRRDHQRQDQYHRHDHRRLCSAILRRTIRPADTTVPQGTGASSASSSPELRAVHSDCVFILARLRSIDLRAAGHSACPAGGLFVQRGVCALSRDAPAKDAEGKHDGQGGAAHRGHLHDADGVWNLHGEQPGRRAWPHPAAQQCDAEHGGPEEGQHQPGHRDEGADAEERIRGGAPTASSSRRPRPASPRRRRGARSARPTSRNRRADGAGGRRTRTGWKLRRAWPSALAWAAALMLAWRDRRAGATGLPPRAARCSSV